MYFSAVSVGYAVPQNNFDATVHSVFQSAVNLQLGNSSDLLTIVVNGQTDLPQGIRIMTQKPFSFENMHRDEIVTCRGRKLRFGSPELVIDLRNAQIWKCDLPGLMADMTNSSFANSWGKVWRALGTQPGELGDKLILKDLIFPSEKILSGRFQKVEDVLFDLVESTRRCDLAASHTIGKMIGLGTGLTPSFDDFLVGYLAGLWCTARGRSECVKYLSELGKEVRRYSARTNDISRTYICHATHGQISSLLFTLAKSICHGETSNNLINKAKAAMQVGHMSGKAALVGLLFGLVTWNGNQLPKESVETMDFFDNSISTNYYFE